MTLHDDQIRALVRALSLTQELEINCNECLDLVAEFAEREFSGRPIPDALEAVRHHLALCGECRDEYEALFRSLRRLDEAGES
jgi:uncharacterized protein with PIN domain